MKKGKLKQWLLCFQSYGFILSVGEHHVDRVLALFADRGITAAVVGRVTGDGLLVLHARLFYTEEILVRNGTIQDPELFRETVFKEYHQRGNRLASEGAILKLFERFGVSEEEFSRTWNSFEVDQKLRVAQDLARRYSISSVPAIVVNGKYRTGAQEVGSNERWMELVDELILRESAR